MQIFDDDSDRESFIRILKAKSEKYGLEIRSWCLMPNHYHLIVIPDTEKSMTLAIGRANWAYVNGFNERCGEAGSLVQRKFYSAPMDHVHYVSAVRYILQNPVKAGLSNFAWQYRWSCAMYLVGKTHSDPLLRNRKIICGIEDWYEFLSVSEYRSGFIRKCTSSGDPCGGSDFQNLVSSITGLEYPKNRKGRPSKQSS